MRPLERSHQGKRKGAAKFKRQIRRTKGANVSPAPMRGGIRM